MLPIIIFITLIIIYLIFYIKSKRYNTIGISLILMYLLSAICSLYLYDLERFEYDGVNLLSYLFLFILLIITFTPILQYTPNKYKCIKEINHNIVELVSVILCVLYVPNVIKVFSEVVLRFDEIISNLSVVAEMYEETAKKGSALTGSNFGNPIVILVGAFTEILVFWTFYYWSLNNKKRIISILLLLSCLYPPLASFLSGSRTGMLYWLIHLGCSYMIMYPFYSNKIKRIINNIVIPVSASIVLLFVVLTIGRFANIMTTQNIALEYAISYAGQSTLNFSRDVLKNNVKQKGDNTSPVFRQMIGLESSSNLYERQKKWSGKMKITQGAFYTIWGDFCFDFGPIITMLLFLIFSYFIKRHIVSSTNEVKVFQLFLLFFWCSVCFNGLFYYSYKTTGGNLKIITTILFYIFLRLKCITINNKYGEIHSTLSSSISPNTRK